MKFKPIDPAPTDTPYELSDDAVHYLTVGPSVPDLTLLKFIFPAPTARTSHSSATYYNARRFALTVTCEDGIERLPLLQFTGATISDSAETIKVCVPANDTPASLLLRNGVNEYLFTEIAPGVFMVTAQHDLGYGG